MFSLQFYITFWHFLLIPVMAIFEVYKKGGWERRNGHINPVYLWSLMIRFKVGRLYQYLGFYFLLRIYCEITKVFWVHSVSILTIIYEMHFIYKLFTTDIKIIVNCVLLHEFLRTISAASKAPKNFLSGWYELQLFYTFWVTKKM